MPDVSITGEDVQIVMKAEIARPVVPLAVMRRLAAFSFGGSWRSWRTRQGVF